MNTFSNRVLLMTLATLPVSGWATTTTEASLMAGHWDGVALIALGTLIVWREVRSAKLIRAVQRNRNGWSALNSWRHPVRNRSGLLPSFAKLSSKRTRR